MRMIAFVLGCLWLLAPAHAAVKRVGPPPPVGRSLAEVTVQQKLQKLLGKPLYQKAKIGIDVVAMGDHRTVFSHDAETLLSPASNMKILTSVTALLYLKPDFRFKTHLYTTGTLKEGVLDGDLYVEGMGDPLLVSERLWYLSNELAALGLKKINGDLIADDTYFDDVRAPPGWDEDQSDMPYQALISALSVNFNTITVRVLPAAEAGALGQVFVDPPGAYAKLESQVKTVDHGKSQMGIEVEPLTHSVRSLIKLKGRINVADAVATYRRKADYPTEFSLDVIHAFLGKAGIKVKGRLRRGRLPRATSGDKAPKPLLTIESPRLADVVDDLNKTSNNFIAEQLLKTLGAAVVGVPGTTSKGLQVINQLLSQLGIAAADYQIQNGSGLGDVNRLSARQLVKVLDYAWHMPMIQPEFVRSLGVAGASGTLRHRMQNGPGAYWVRAKTGTLRDACALSGYVNTYGGEVLAFSILINGFKRLSDAHALQDEIAETLVQLGSPLGSSDKADEALTPQASPAQSEEERAQPHNP